MSAISRLVDLHSFEGGESLVPRNCAPLGCNRVLRSAPYGSAKVQTVMCCDTSHAAILMTAQNACTYRSFLRRDSPLLLSTPGGSFLFQYSACSMPPIAIFPVERPPSRTSW